MQFPITGPLRYTMTAEDAVELCRLVRPRTTIPIHYEGWKHFRQGRHAVERVFATAPAEFRDRVRWLPIGDPDRRRRLTSATSANDPTSLSSLTTGGSSQRSRTPAWNALNAARPVSGLPAAVGVGEVDEGDAVGQLERRVAQPARLDAVELLVDGADELLVASDLLGLDLVADHDAGHRVSSNAGRRAGARRRPGRAVPASAPSRARAAAATIAGAKPSVNACGDA